MSYTGFQNLTRLFNAYVSPKITINLILYLSTIYCRPRFRIKRVLFFFSSKTNKSTPRHRYLNNICVAHPRTLTIARINHLPQTFYPTQQFLCTYILRWFITIDDFGRKLRKISVGTYSRISFGGASLSYLHHAIFPTACGSCSPIVGPNNSQCQSSWFLQG